MIDWKLYVLISCVFWLYARRYAAFLSPGFICAHKALWWAYLQGAAGKKWTMLFSDKKIQNSQFASLSSESNVIFDNNQTINYLWSVLGKEQGCAETTSVGWVAGHFDQWFLKKGHKKCCAKFSCSMADFWPTFWRRLPRPYWHIPAEDSSCILFITSFIVSFILTVTPFNFKEQEEALRHFVLRRSTVKAAQEEL